MMDPVDVAEVDAVAVESSVTVGLAVASLLSPGILTVNR